MTFDLMLDPIQHANQAHTSVKAIESNLTAVRYKARLTVADIGRDEQERWEVHVPAILMDVDRAERDADNELQMLQDRLGEVRSRMGSRRGMDLTDDELASASQMVAGFKEITDPDTLVDELKSASKHEGKARAAAWTMLESHLRGLSFNGDSLGLKRNHVASALMDCKRRVVVDRATDDQKAVDDALTRINSVRADIADRRGDGETGGALLRYRFGNPRHAAPHDPAKDREAVLWRVREAEPSVDMN